MKKIAIILSILFSIIFLFGCQAKKVEEVNAYDFEYKFKDYYSDKISSEIAEAFTDFTRDTRTLYAIGLEDFELTVEEEFSEYMGKVVLAYKETEYTLNSQESELLALMEKQWDNANTLYLLKLYYQEDETNKSVGIKTKYKDEYYDRELMTIKARIEDTLHSAGKFIN